MDRRSFLRGLGVVISGVAVEQAIPLGRVWSFPKQIVIQKSLHQQYCEGVLSRESFPLAWLHQMSLPVDLVRKYEVPQDRLLQEIDLIMGFAPAFDSELEKYGITSPVQETSRDK